MGMFDNIKCDYPLPFPDDLKGISKERLLDEVYQTKDFDKSFDYYLIKSDGTLWHEDYDIEDHSNPNAKGFERYIGCMTRVNKHLVQLSDYTGVVNFYSFIEIESSQYDYWIEFDCKFINGILVNCNLVKFEATDNLQRKESSIKFKNEMKQRNLLWSKWYMKYLYKHYDTFIHRIFRFWNKISNKFPAYKIERFLRPL